MITIEGTDELLARVRPEAMSEWSEITRQTVDEFAAATGGPVAARAR